MWGEARLTDVDDKANAVEIVPFLSCWHLPGSVVCSTAGVAISKGIVLSDSGTTGSTFASKDVWAPLSTIHFSRIKRWLWVKSFLIASFRRSRGIFFNKSRICIKSLVCFIWNMSLALLFSPTFGLFNPAFLGRSAGRGVFGLPLAVSRCVGNLPVVRLWSYFLRVFGSVKVSSAWYTIWNSSLLPPLSGWTCSARRLKAIFISSKVAFWSTSSTS